MSNLKVVFDNAWLFLLLIPAIAVALWPYFRLEKKYRRTRNRVISLVLHICIMIFSITALTGVAFKFEAPITENELIIVVDVSYSSQNTQEEKNAFVSNLLQSKDPSFRVGVVIFGATQRLVAPLSLDINDVGRLYTASLKEGEPVGDASTNIAAALDFAAAQIENPKGSKIVLLSDGLENEDSAIVKIGEIISKEITVDTVCFDNNYGNEIQIISAVLPDFNVTENEPAQISLIIESTLDCAVAITILDNLETGVVAIESDENEKGYVLSEEPLVKQLVMGTNTIRFDYVFKELGEHQMFFQITPVGGSEENPFDTISQNNNYYAYTKLMSLDSLLIISKDNNAEKLLEMMEDSEDYFNYSAITELDIFEAPTDINALSVYNQIILMNISNSDMDNVVMPVKEDGTQDRFIDLLYDYVHNCGGGLFTVGGDGPTDDSGIYSINEMYIDGNQENPTRYQQMLPVDCNEYKPPVSVILALDTSGSMGPAENNGTDMLKIAKEAIIQIAEFNYLSPRDYLGLVEFSDKANLFLPLQELPHHNKIAQALETLKPGGGTDWTKALTTAITGFAGSTVSRKHIVLVTDGEPMPDISNAWRTLMPKIEECVKRRITISIISIGTGAVTAASSRVVNYFNDLWHEYYPQEKNHKGIVDQAAVIGELKGVLEELFGSDGIKLKNEVWFYPEIADPTPAVRNIKQVDMPGLKGFYGVKPKEDLSVNVPLMGEFTPVYAHWNYGKGKVGSFMCDLEGNWSDIFMADETGRHILDNIIGSLFSSEDIKMTEIVASIIRTNDKLQISIENDDIAANLEYTIEVTDITMGRKASPVPIEPMLLEVSRAEGRPKASCQLDELGIYKITITRIDPEGKFNSELTVYNTFSYSEEYNAFPPVLGSELMTKLATGRFIQIDEEANAVQAINYSRFYAGVSTTEDKEWSPNIILIMTVLIMFLLDIAVRKFKFKWPWEIIRDRKLKKQLQ